MTRCSGRSCLFTWLVDTPTTTKLLKCMCSKHRMYMYGCVQVSRQMDSYRKPAVFQEYNVPYPQNDIYQRHDETIYSVWMHFVMFCVSLMKDMKRSRTSSYGHSQHSLQSNLDNGSFGGPSSYPYPYEADSQRGESQVYTQKESMILNEYNVKNVYSGRAR